MKFSTGLILAALAVTVANATERKSLRATDDAENVDETEKSIGEDVVDGNKPSYSTLLEKDVNRKDFEVDMSDLFGSNSGMGDDDKFNLLDMIGSQPGQISRKDLLDAFGLGSDGDENENETNLKSSTTHLDKKSNSVLYSSDEEDGLQSKKKSGHASEEEDEESENDVNIKNGAHEVVENDVMSKKSSILAAGEDDESTKTTDADDDDINTKKSGHPAGVSTVVDDTTNIKSGKSSLFATEDVDETDESDDESTNVKGAVDYDAVNTKKSGHVAGVSSVVEDNTNVKGGKSSLFATEDVDETDESDDESTNVKGAVDYDAINTKKSGHVAGVSSVVEDNTNVKGGNTSLFATEDVDETDESDDESTNVKSNDRDTSLKAFLAGGGSLNVKRGDQLDDLSKDVPGVPKNSSLFGAEIGKGQQSTADDLHSKSNPLFGDDSTQVKGGNKSSLYDGAAGTKETVDDESDVSDTSMDDDDDNDDDDDDANDVINTKTGKNLLYTGNEDVTQSDVTQSDITAEKSLDTKTDRLTV